MANELLIKINADAKNAKKAFDDIRDKTTDLEGQLRNVAFISGAAFAAFTAEIFFSAKAFEEAEKNAIQLTNALQNQGIFTEELRNEYSKFADVVQAKTGIDDDAITKAQAVAQTFLGQTEITEDLTFAIADLAASMGGDLNGAAEKIARTIGTGTNAFARQGLVMKEGATEAERYAQVLEFVQSKAGGLAEAFNKADGYSQALSTSIGNFQESIGKYFAPALAAGRQALIGFFDLFTNNPALAKTAAVLIAVGAAITGLIAAAAVGIPIFLSLSAAATAFGISLSFALLGIPLIIGAIVAAITALALNWTSVMNGIKQATTEMSVLVSEMFGGLGKIIAAAFTLDKSKLVAGFEQIAGAFRKSADAGRATAAELTEAQKKELEIQDADKKLASDKKEAQERIHQQNLRNIRQAEIELLKLQNQNASAAIIDLKTQEIAVLKALDSQKSAEELVLFKERKAEIQALQEQQNAEDFERANEFNILMAEMKAEYQALNGETDNVIRMDRLAQVRATAMTEADVERKMQEEILADKIKARNQELIDRRKFGQDYATINKALNSDEVNAAKGAADGLVSLANSKNSSLKAIGKAAAVTQIGIDTARGAMAVYANFQTAIPYPPVSIPLGIAAAAALTLYGAERVSAVMGAADGALVTGGVSGRDSVPFMLEPGELVTPKRNFEEVVGAVQTSREGGGNAEMLSVLQSIDNKFSAPQITQIAGDVTADDSYIDSLVRRISDAIEFRNAKIFGVTG